MTLDDNDWEKMGKLLDNKLKPLSDTIGQLQSDVSHAGKRIQRLETGFSRLANASRKKGVESARKDHDRLLRGMFDAAHLLALPPLIEDDPVRRFQRHQAKCTADDVRKAIQGVDGVNFEFDVELARPVGFRIIFSSRGPQSRRKHAAHVLKHCKDALTTLELTVQYDKPYELREIQRSAHKFMGVVVKRAGPLLTSKSISKGFLEVNGVRLAPECLVPNPGCWDRLAELVKAKIRSLKSSSYVPEDGVMYDVFGTEFAADHGVFSLDDILLEEEDDGGGSDIYMQHLNSRGQ